MDNKKGGGPPRRQVRGSARERLEDYRDLLGTVPDKEISRRTGISVRAARRSRRPGSASCACCCGSGLLRWWRP